MVVWVAYVPLLASLLKTWRRETISWFGSFPSNHHQSILRVSVGDFGGSFRSSEEEAFTHGQINRIMSFDWFSLRVFSNGIAQKHLCQLYVINLCVQSWERHQLAYHNLWLVGVLAMRWLLILLWFLLHLQFKNGNLSI